jgi:hypothetical protein
MSKLRHLKVIGPILLIAIPLIIVLAIFADEYFGSHAEEYVPEGEVLYQLTTDEESE